MTLQLFYGLPFQDPIPPTIFTESVALPDSSIGGCKGALIIDARIKPFHAPPLVQDSRVVERVKRLGLAGGPLHGII